jgi:hypothetical protein
MASSFVSTVYPAINGVVKRVRFEERKKANPFGPQWSFHPCQPSEPVAILSPKGSSTSPKASSTPDFKSFGDFQTSYSALITFRI